MKTLSDLVRWTWCRVVYGHLMIDLGTNDETGKRLWMCERCHMPESLERLV